MKVNGEEYNIDKLVSDIDFNKNKLKKINNNLDLTNYQIDVLKRFDIDIEKLPSLSSIIAEAEEVYEDNPDEDLEVVLDELAERNYYENTNK
jgi:hypothetical protein